MGLEADCVARVGGRESEGHARLEDKDLRFRGETGVGLGPGKPFTLAIPFSDVKSAEARNGWLHVTHAGGEAAFRLGAAAETWALKIRYPRRLIDKLGIKAAARVSVLGVTDPAFWAQLNERAADVSRRLRADAQVIVWGAQTVEELDRLSALRDSLASDGAIWVIWAKGKKALREDDVRAAAKRHGLVDVKVVSFSETQSGLKLMIPKRLR